MRIAWKPCHFWKTKSPIILVCWFTNERQIMKGCVLTGGVFINLLPSSFCQADAVTAALKPAKVCFRSRSVISLCAVETNSVNHLNKANFMFTNGEGDTVKLKTDVLHDTLYFVWTFSVLKDKLTAVNLENWLFNWLLCKVICMSARASEPVTHWQHL